MQRFWDRNIPGIMRSKKASLTAVEQIRERVIGNAIGDIARGQEIYGLIGLGKDSGIHSIGVFWTM